MVGPLAMAKMGNVSGPSDTVLAQVLKSSQRHMLPLSHLVKENAKIGADVHTLYGTHGAKIATSLTKLQQLNLTGAGQTLHSEVQSIASLTIESLCYAHLSLSIDLITRM